MDFKLRLGQESPVELRFCKTKRFLEAVFFCFSSAKTQENTKHVSHYSTT